MLKLATIKFNFALKPMKVLKIFTEALSCRRRAFSYENQKRLIYLTYDVL